jgi:hypothetical protein
MVSALPHPGLRTGSTGGLPLSGPASPIGVIDIVPLLVVPLLGATVPLLMTVPLVTTVPLLIVPLVGPRMPLEPVPELAPLIAPAAVPWFAPEPMTGGSLVRPPHAPMARSTNERSDHRPRLSAEGGNTAHYRTEAAASL